ncbi:MAG: MoaD/ThiS family protein [Candidatus Methylomirabilota bacterium]|jgi:molybdopterin converting factor small subunit
MNVEIALYATLSKYLPPGAQNRKAVIEVKDGATVREVMNQLGIPPDLPNMLLVNGRQAPDGTVIKNGETLSIFPPLAGGAASARPPLAGGCDGGWPSFADDRSASGPLIRPG